MGFLSNDTPAPTSPPPPPPLPPAAHPATAASGAVQATADQAKKRAQMAAGAGFSGTDVTKGQAAAPSTAKATLLGDTDK